MGHQDCRREDLDMNDFVYFGEGGGGGGLKGRWGRQSIAEW